MGFINMFESDEVEAARLAESPEGSKNYELSMLPVRSTIIARENRLVMLPRLTGESRTVVVLPTTYHRATGHSTAAPIKRDGSYDCVIVQSDDPRYPVGGYDINVSEAELRRGVLCTPSFSYDAMFSEASKEDGI